MNNIENEQMQRPAIDVDYKAEYEKLAVNYDKLAESYRKLYAVYLQTLNAYLGVTLND